MKSKRNLKIAMVATIVPSRKSGDTVRNYNLIAQYVKHGYNVTLFCIVEPKTQEDVDHLRDRFGITVVAVPPRQLSLPRRWWAILWHKTQPALFGHRLSKLGEQVLKEVTDKKIDIVQIEQTFAYYAIQPVIPDLKRRGTVLILDAHNVEQRAFRRMIDLFSFPKKLQSYYLLPQYKKIENQAVQTVDHIFACSNEEADFFHLLTKADILHVPNGVDCEYFDIEVTGKNSLLFMGGMGYPPNSEAMQWYFSEIHPTVNQHIKNLKVYVLGSKPPEWLMRLQKNDPTIITPGHVKDVRDYLKIAAICISPMLSGFGTALKIVEYMASGRSVVSTTVGVRGLEVKNGTNVMIADTAAEFSNKIIELLKNKAKNKKIGAAARTLMQNSYDWNAIGDHIDTFLKK